METVKRLSVNWSRIYWLLVAVVVLEIMDGVITYFLLKGGHGREGNPLLGTLPGDLKFVAVKALAGILCAFILADICRRWPKLGTISSSLIVAGLAGVVVWNVFAYFISVV